MLANRNCTVCHSWSVDFIWTPLIKTNIKGNIYSFSDFLVLHNFEINCLNFLQIDHFLSVSKLKYYFAVDTNYVIKKLALLVFPFTHQV